MARTSAVAALRDRLAEATAELNVARRGAEDAIAELRWERKMRSVDLRAIWDLTAERDRLRDAIDAIPRHTPWADTGRCSECGSLGWPDAWPCRTEQAHIAATQSTASAEDRAATTGRVNASHLVGEGPHDATSNPSGGSAEGTLPAPKDDGPGDGGHMLTGGIL